MSIMDRYTGEDVKVIYKFFEKLASNTRKSGKILDSKKESIVREWENFDKDVVINALNIYLTMPVEVSRGGRGKNEKYVLGIMLNKQVEKSKKAGVSSGKFKKDSGRNKCKTGEDEGERLQKFVRDGNSENIECDF